MKLPSADTLVATYGWRDGKFCRLHDKPIAIEEVDAIEGRCRLAVARFAAFALLHFGSQKDLIELMEML